MAHSRPSSMIIPGGVFDETNGKNSSIKMDGRSSTSSIDSTSGKNINFNEQKSLSQNLLSTATSSTTTDSDFESEQDEKQQKNDSNQAERLSRRVRQFRKLFKSEIPDPMPEVINSYVCAYQGDILLQGKMYITDRYLCFHSRIINYVTKHVYRWEQIASVRKERVAFIFPTAICIQLKQTGKKIVYASFIQRDQAYETILSVLSKSTNDIHMYDDDDNELAHDGTLKANNHQDKLTRESYDNSEQDVLEMCLKQSNQRRAHSVPRKPIEEKHSLKKILNGKHSLKTSNQEEKLPNNPTIRTSRYTKNEQKPNDTIKKQSLKIQQRSQSTPRLEQTNDIISSSTIESSISNSNSNGILNIILSFTSQIKPYISSYPMKITLIILLILTILFFHAFYLVKLAYRIENRLQSLHHHWPSSSSSMKNSFSSNIKEL